MQLSIETQFAIDRDGDGFHVRSTAYAYELLDRDRREIVACHRHPTGVSPVTLADIVRPLITEFNVEPRRPNWAAVLDAHRDPFAADH